MRHPRIPPLYRVVVAVVRVPVLLITRRRWSGVEHLPADGGFIAAGNHLSNFDPLTFLHFLVDNGHYPKILGKSSLFTVPVLGWVLRGCGMIPVYRGTERAVDSLRQAEDVLRRGDSVAVFPEGTLSRDPQMWPMVAKTGAARLALATRVPVIPIAQWGAHHVLPRYSSRFRPIPPKQVTVQAGPPVDLSDLYDLPLDDAVLREATRRIMARITVMLADIRGEAPPAQPYHHLDGSGH